MKAESKNRALGKFFQNQVGQYYFKIDENDALVILNWAYDRSNSQEPPQTFRLVSENRSNQHTYFYAIFICSGFYFQTTNKLSTLLTL